MGLVDRWFIKQPRLRRWVTRLIYGNKDHTIQMLGADFRVNAMLENGYLRAARKSRTSSFLRDELAVMLNLTHFAKAGGAFIDAGANIGVYSIVFSRLSRILPGFTVDAFEVRPDTYARLQVNAHAHGFSAHGFALGANDETLEFVAGAVSHVTCVAHKANKASFKSDGFRAECRRLSSLQWTSHDIILKVDVEGFEYEVLLGAADLFAQRRICCVYVDGFDDPRVPELLLAHGFALHDGRTLEPVSGWVYALLAIRR